VKDLKFAETRDTPYVRFSLSEKYCLIKGKSYPPDISKFFDPILDWLENLKKVEFDTMSFNVMLEYYNTATSKMILNILYVFEELAQLGKEIFVNWYYPIDDDDMLDAGEEFERLVDLPFRHVEYEQEF